MNLVELINALRIEAGASGRPITTAQGVLTGESERLRKWIIDAWRDIQRKHIDWRFLFVESSYVMSVDESTLNPTEYEANEVAQWHGRSFKIAKAGGAWKDAERLPFRQYFDWIENDGRDLTVNGKPNSITVHPTTEALMVAPPADDEYVLFYNYWRTPQTLVDDDEEPIMPERYHDLIVYWALKKYAVHEVAPEAIMRADVEVKRLLSDLELDQLPAITTASLGEDW
jgi:hypothetical protein